MIINNINFNYSLLFYDINKIKYCFSLLTNFFILYFLLDIH
jgi:hypothetical protein